MKKILPELVNLSDVIHLVFFFKTIWGLRD